MSARKLPTTQILKKKRPLPRPQALLALAQREIERSLGVKDFDPVVFLMTLAADPDAKMSDRKDAAKAVCPYVHSTLKAVEITGEDGGPIDVNLATSKERLALMIGANADIIDIEVTPTEVSTEEDTA